jgi:sulfate/thiosulfate transport system substrate-binding protein
MQQTVNYHWRSKKLSQVKKCLSWFLLSLFLNGSLAACAASSKDNTNRKSEIDLTLVSFAVTKAAHEAIIPKFVEKWQKEKGQTVKFKQSYGGSGSQARAVVDGLEADIVHLALASDTQKIEKAGLIDPGWEAEYPNSGVVTKSVVALVTQEGNPKGIKDWADLAQPGVKVVTADPKTSGVARWNFLALWNAALKGGDESKAQDFVTQVFKNVAVLAKDAREATDIFFKQKQGDALINYENEMLLAQAKGTKVSYTVPAVNISIDNPIAVVDKNATKHGTQAVAAAFVQYLYTPEAQAEFAKLGFRPVEETTAKANTSKYPAIANLSTIKDFGGWKEAQKKFFEDGGVFDQIQKANQK